MSENVSEETYAQYDLKLKEKKAKYIIKKQITQTSSDTSVIYRYSHKQHCFVRSSEVQRVHFHFSYDGPYQFGGSIQIVPKKRDIFNIQNKSVQTDNIRQTSVRVDTEQKIIKEVSGSFSRSQIYDAYFAKKPTQTASPAELAEQARRRQARLLDALVLAETLLCEKAAPPVGFLAQMNIISPPKYDYWVQHQLEQMKIDEISNTQSYIPGLYSEYTDTLMTEPDREASTLKMKQTMDSNVIKNTIDLSEQNITNLSTIHGVQGQNQSDLSIQRIETLPLHKCNINNMQQSNVTGQNTPDTMLSNFTSNILQTTNDDITRQVSADSNDPIIKTKKSINIRKPAATAVCLGSEYLVAFGALLQVYSRLNTFHAAFKHHFAQEITCICQIGTEVSDDEMNAGLVLIGLRDGNLVLLDRNLQQLDEQHFHEGAVSAVQKKPSTNLFVSVCMGGVICFSRVTDGKIYLIYKTELPNIQILSLFLGRLHFAVGTDQGSVIQFEYYRKSPLYTYSQEDGLSPTFYYGIGEINGELVVCGEDGVLRAVNGGHEVFMADQPLYSIYGLRHGRALLQGQSMIYLLQSTTQPITVNDKQENFKQIDKPNTSGSSINLINTLDGASKSIGVSLKQDNASQSFFQSFDEHFGFQVNELLKDDPLNILYEQQDKNIRPSGLQNAQQLEILDFIEIKGMTRITINLEDDIALIGTESSGVLILKIGQDLQVEQSTKKIEKKQQKQMLKQNKSRAAMLTGRHTQLSRNLLPNAGAHDLLTGTEGTEGAGSGVGSTTTGSTYISKSIFTRVVQ